MTRAFISNLMMIILGNSEIDSETCQKVDNLKYCFIAHIF